MNLDYSIPTGWTFPLFESLATPIKGAIKIGPFGSALKKNEFSQDGIRVLGIDHIKPVGLVWELPKYIPESKYAELTQYTVSDNDVLVTNMGTVGKACIVPVGFPKAIISSHLIKVTLDQDRCYPEYIALALNHCPIVVAQIKAKCHGAIMAGFNSSLLKSIKLPLPPLPEQKRIAAILDKADSIRRKRQEAVRLTEELLRSVFLDMFGDPVTNPKGWETRAFVAVCDTRLGKMLDASQQTGEHLRPYLRNSNVQWDRIETSDLEQMDFNEKDRKTFSLKNGDVLICEGGEVGRAAIWRNQLTDCYFQKAIHRARPNQSLALPEYVMFWLWFMAKNGGFKDHVTSATIAHLTGEKLKEIQVALPPITLQHQFLRVYNSLTKLKTSTYKYQTHTERLFNSILQQVFNGEFVEFAKLGFDR